MNLDALHIYHDEAVRNRVINIAKNQLDPDEERADNYAEMILEAAFVNGRSFFHRSADLNALSELEKAIAKLVYQLDSSLTSEARHTLNMYFLYGSAFDTLYQGDSINNEKAKDYREEKGNTINRAVNELVRNIKEIRCAINLTKKRIENSSQAKQSPSKINIHGINLVDISRHVWAVAHKRDAPSSDLNIATAFGHFLSDLFDACGIEGDPRSAFRAWVREQEAQSLDRPE
ncbi:hypothetical protein MUY21_07850 [Aliiroseovarius sp. S2029]|uniref:hypothetical protein n=1 Tax=Aliiroseovarius sp. S2029 TaxID=2936988 RepID=UPI0020BDB4A4|nr:hypothetical protein [Aliiroseovarius sp. S2029]MCK8483947.1 hypothetical protein [Aliiroseovarius sp. S2029]